MHNLKQSSLKWCWLSLLVIVLDQISKYFITLSLTPYQPIALTPFFNLTLMYNEGAAFGFLSHYPQLAFAAFSAIALLMAIILIVWLYRTPTNQRWTAIALALVLGGAIGNAVDRFVHGHVIDFLDFYYRNWHFWAFNVADSAITIGAILLFFQLFFADRKVG